MKCVHYPRCPKDCIDCCAEAMPAEPAMLSAAQLAEPDGPGEDDLPTAILIEQG